MRFNLLRKTLFLFLLLDLLSCSFSRKVFPGSFSNEKFVLLELKTRFSDPSGILSSWDPDSSDHCSWFGISCDSKSRVVSLIIRGCDGHRGSFDSPDLSSCSGNNGRLGGEISPAVGKLAEIRVLWLAGNDLGGQIPEEIWGLENLEALDLQGNSFTGKLPEHFPGLKKIRVLNPGFNQISREIPSVLSKSTNLEVSNPAYNRLEPSILGFLTNFGKPRKLDLSDNRLYGPIPVEHRSNCRYFQHLDLSTVFLTGELPPSPERCGKGKDISRIFGFLHKTVTVELDELPRAEVSVTSGDGDRDLAPVEAVKMSKHPLSFHRLFKLRKLMALDEGDEDSQNVRGSNSDGETSPSPSGKNGLYPIEIASIVSASVIVFVLLVLVILFFYTRKWKRNSQVQVAETREIRVFLDIGVPLTYENIVRATGYFSNSNCIGHGGFGSTYRAEVSPDTVVAVKRLSVGRFQGVQQFHAEIKTLEMVRHSNLVMLIGYHASETEMFLIYNYLPGGNLENFIKERSKAALQWKILHKIALDVARALAYLHEECSPKVLHRDIKPSNILLDNNFNAYLSDFGLSKLLGTSQSHVTTGVAGTFGYVAPEYAMTCRVSDKADVYSYGIVLLELISDKKALDPSFSSHENGFNIVSWAHMMLRQGKAKDVFTRGLWDSGPQDDLVEVLHLALRCTVESLSTRPTMKQVVQQLRKIRPA